MSIAVSLKVHDGVVLAADSATTLLATDQATGKPAVFNVYNNANKVFNLHKGLPVGAITWGVGGIGVASISTLAKDLRKELQASLNADSYTIQEIAQRTYEFYYLDRYKKAFDASKPESCPPLGMVIAGYSSDAHLASEWRFDVKNGTCDGPRQQRPDEASGICWNGQPEAISRLVLGFGSGLGQALSEMSVPKDQLGPALEHLRRRMHIELTPPAMPIQDAIDLARFLVETTIQFSRFAPGAPTVGGPVEIATITKHESFKWISRKLYYDSVLNPSRAGWNAQEAE